MKTILYLGTDPTHFDSGSSRLIHYPVIKIVPRPMDDPEIAEAFAALDEYTHLIFTSKNAVKVFFDNPALLSLPLSNLKTVIAIGKVTAEYLSVRGLPAHYVSSEETQEGVVELLGTTNLQNAYIFMPRSSQSRPVLANFFNAQQLRYRACDLYDTVTCAIGLKPDLGQIDEFVFTSPSTVRAFIEIFGSLPEAGKCRAIGPVTQEEVDRGRY